MSIENYIIDEPGVVIPETAKRLSGIPFPLWGKVGWGLLEFSLDSGSRVLRTLARNDVW